MVKTAKLILLCGKMAAGKSTLARELTQQGNVILLMQDELLDQLFPGEIVTISDFIKYSTRLNQALTPLICDLLNKGMSVILDFPGNTKRQRAWFRQLIDRADVDHELHYIEASDERCKHQLRERSQGLPSGTAWTTDAEFDAVTAYFEPPTPDERFRVIVHASG
jgi:predicted kinase